MRTSLREWAGRIMSIWAPKEEKLTNLNKKQKTKIKPNFTLELYLQSILVS